MSITINGIQLTKEEETLCNQTLETACSIQNGALKLLETNFENGAEIYADISRGVDEFFTLYADDFTSDDIRNHLTAILEGQSIGHQLIYLTNALVIISNAGSKLHMNDAWDNLVDEYKSVVEALADGRIDESDISEETISRLLDYICDHVEDSAVLLVGAPIYSSLMNACQNSSPDEVEQLAANTRESSIAMAASIYALYAHGHLDSLKDHQYTPYEFGVMTACTLEIDAAAKTGVWEKVKSVIIKASRVALTLLIGTAILYVLTMELPLMYNLNTMWLAAYEFHAIELLSHIEMIERIVSIVSLGLSIFLAPKVSNALWNFGEKFVRSPGEAVHDTYLQFRDWINNTVVPAMWEKWNACSNFVYTHIIQPLSGAKKNDVENAPNQNAPVQEAPVRAPAHTYNAQPDNVYTEDTIVT